MLQEEDKRLVMILHVVVVSVTVSVVVHLILPCHKVHHPIKTQGTDWWMEFLLYFFMFCGNRMGGGGGVVCITGRHRQVYIIQLYLFWKHLCQRNPQRRQEDIING